MKKGIVHKPKKGRRFFISGLVILTALLLFAFRSWAADLTPPEISNIVLKDVTEDSVTITWETDEDSDSMINYGLRSDYGIERDPIPDKTEHELTITDLLRARTYHLRVVSSDRWGNQNVSGDFSVTTGGIDDIDDIEKVELKDQQEIVAQTFQLLDEVVDPDALILIADKVQDVAKRIILPPTIMGDPNVRDIGMNYAIVHWTTDRESNSRIDFAADYEYAEGDENPYAHTQGQLDDFTTDHEVTLIGLQPGTLYHIQASSEGEFNLLGRSIDVTFTTKSELPVILNFNIVKTEETSATLAWNTSVPASGQVEYTNLSNGEVRSEGSPELLQGHTVRLGDLTFGTRYSAVVKARNALDDEVISEPIMFVTTKDEFAPIITRVTNESTLYPGADTKIQTIISWGTDEPAICQFHYRQGIAPGADSVDSLPEQEPTTDHVQVMIEFLPSTVYKYWVSCVDHAENASESEDFVLFTPEKEKSIIDIILENFEGTFGWVKNIGK